MSKPSWLFTFLFAIHGFIITPPTAAEQKIVYTRAFDGQDYDYYHAEVLRAALAATPEYGSTQTHPHPHPMPQIRQIKELVEGRADIMWSATSNEREQLLLPVRFPLLQGLSGKRVMIIRKGHQKDFPNGLSASQIKNKVAVVGTNWPDMKIMEYNGYRVMKEGWSNWFTSMFNSVQRGVVDYFPRNVIEVSRDLRRHADKDIELEQHYLLSYPNYEFFFVAPERPELVERITLGLIRLLENGELTRLFTRYTDHEIARKMAKDPTRTVLNLTNPYLTQQIRYPDWIATPDAALKELQSRLHR